MCIKSGQGRGCLGVSRVAGWLPRRANGKLNTIVNMTLTCPSLFFFCNHVVLDMPTDDRWENANRKSCLMFTQTRRHRCKMIYKGLKVQVRKSVLYGTNAMGGGSRLRPLW